MHKKICIWCGTEFECQYSHRKLCSTSCKKQHDAEHHRKYCDEHPEMVAEWKRRKRIRDNQRRKIKDVQCRICGEVVSPVVGNYHRWYHEECIIKEGLEALSEGASMSDPRLNRCKNRLGYSKAELLEELEWKQNLEK